MGEPVEQGAGEPFRTEDLGPLLEGQVAGDQRRGPFTGDLRGGGRCRYSLSASSGHMQRLRLSHLPSCYESLAETAAAKNLPYLDFLEQLLEAESAAKHARNVRLKTQWAHFPYSKGLAGC